MNLAQILLKLWKLRKWVAIGGVLATVAAIASVTTMSSPVFATASTQMLVDAPKSALADAGTDLTGFTTRAVVFARLMTTPEALNYIGQAAGIPGNLIAASGPVELAGPNAVHTPTSVKGGQINSPTVSYKLDFLQNPELPTVDIYSQAPTTAQAIALANGAVKGFAAYVATLEATSAIPGGRRVEIRQLGGASGGVVNAGAGKTLAVMIFVIVCLVWCGLVLFVTNLREQLRAAKAARDPRSGEDAPASNGAEYAPPMPQYADYTPPAPPCDVPRPYPVLMPEQGERVSPNTGGSADSHTRDEHEEEARRGVRLFRH
jgi:hypothetical protein